MQYPAHAPCKGQMLIVCNCLGDGQVNPDKRARSVFWDARFLALAAVLGMGCTASYYVTGGSLVAAALTHWLPVNLWLFVLGGWNKVQPPESSKKE